MRALAHGPQRVPGARSLGAHLFASPLGVVVRLPGETRTERHTVFLLDPESGTVRRRWAASPIMFSLDLHGRDLLEPREDGVFAIDLHTGAERVVLSSESGVRTRSAVVRDGSLVAARADGAWVFTPEEGDAWRLVWRVPLGERRGLVGHRVRPSGDLIYVTSKNAGGGFAALERATGAERWRSSGELRQIDAQGAVAHEGPHDSRAGDTATVLFDRTGQRDWEAHSLGGRRLLIPSSEGRLLVADPSDKAVVELRLDGDERNWDWSTVIVSRGALVTARSKDQALSSWDIQNLLVPS